MNFFVGTSGYSYPAWKGAFYPEKLPAKKFLGYYAEQLRAVESNNTFRSLPKPAALEAAAAQTPPGFRFAPKAPMRITHLKRLKDCGDAVTELFEVVTALKDKLGPVLFQLPPNFKKDADRLRDFLAVLPKGRRVAFEFRHQSWFDDETFALLRSRGAALCLADAEDDLDTPFVATAGWGYIRLRMADYTDAELKAWVKRIRQQKWQDVFVFFKHEDEGKGPQFAKRFLELSPPK